MMPRRAASAFNRSASSGTVMAMSTSVGRDQRCASVTCLGWCLEQPGHDIGGVAVAGLEEVGVDVQGGRCVGVPEPAADRAHRHTRGQQLGGVQMAQVVEAHALDPRRTQTRRNPLVTVSG